MKNWKTIDSAPKDGTQVLLLVPVMFGADPPSVYLARFKDRRILDFDVEIARSTGWFVSGDCLPPDRPSHWMPLPLAPNVD